MFVRLLVSQLLTLFLHSWLPLHPSSLTVNELSNTWKIAMDYGYFVVNWLMDLRRKSHGSFCVLMTAVFIGTGFMGQMVSGVMIIYSMLMMVLLTPGIIVHVIPSEWIPSSSSKGKDADVVDVIDGSLMTKCLYDLLQKSPIDKALSSDSFERELESPAVTVGISTASGSSFVSSAAENVIQIISSHFASSSSSSASSTPASIPSSPKRESTPGSDDDDNDPFVMVTEYDVEKEFLMSSKK